LSYTNQRLEYPTQKPEALLERIIKASSNNGQHKAKEELYVDLILEAYKAKRISISGHSRLHGSKAGRLVHVGPLDVLGFEFEMGLTPQCIQELKEKGVSVTLKYIPKDVFDKRAVEKGQVRFFDVAYLDAKIHPKGRSIQVELCNFVTHFTQDDIEEIQQSMRPGSKVFIEDGQIIKIRKEAGEIVEQWTGNYLFENEWQSFRTKKNPTLEFISIAHECPKAGKYKIRVKIVDILGIDTSKVIEANIK